MQFTLNASFNFSTTLESIQNDLKNFISETENTLFKKEGSIVTINDLTIKENILSVKIISKGVFRPHNALLQLKNTIGKEFGKKHHIGIRNIIIEKYTIDFELEQTPKKNITIPFSDVTFEDSNAKIILKDIDEEFLRKNYIDRMITRVKEKVGHQYYEGKGEFWKLLWESEEKKPVWTKDPTEEMVKRDWLQQGPTKGKWFYRSQSTSIMKAMEKIALDEILTPLNFEEIIESHIVPFDIWLKTGHMEGMPAEFYYISEPVSRNEEQWEKFIDLTKITKEVPVDELQKNLSIPSSGICYAQCPMIYWSLKGKTISEESLPILIYDKTAVSGRYESGGRHGIERVDEFHRIEPVYIGTREQLLDLREKMLEKYKYVFNEILDLDWRMAQVTPWYMQQAGEHGISKESDCGTIDFESYMPYRGSRKESEWLEFQNLSIIGDKYIKSFNIKAQKSELWSGCSGIGLERWTTVFLAQKGLDPNNWPEGFRSYLKTIPKGINFL